MYMLAGLLPGLLAQCTCSCYRSAHPGVGPEPFLVLHACRTALGTIIPAFSKVHHIEELLGWCCMDDS
jgi:hypothetical protein